MFHPVNKIAFGVSASAIAGQAIGYGLAASCARHLSSEGFDAYVVASAAFILMVAFSPRGLDKYALRVLPVLLEQGERRKAFDFVTFAASRTLWTSLAVAAAAGAWACWVRDVPADSRLAIVASCIALPAGALARLMLEALTAIGRPLLATAIFRLGMPLMALSFAGVVFTLTSAASGAMVIACWGLALVVALAVMVSRFARLVPSFVPFASRVEDGARWEAEARTFWIYRISTAVLGQAGVLGVDWLHRSPNLTGAYAAAVATAGLGLVLATATNRIYASQLSVLLARYDFEAIRALHAQRFRWLAGPLTLYLVVTLVFAPDILGLFRPAFVQDGVIPLRVLAGAVAFCVLFALAPTYLKFRCRHAALYLTMAGAAVALLGLLVALVPRLGASGAAIAYAVAMIGMYANFARMANQDLFMMKQREVGI